MAFFDQPFFSGAFFKEPFFGEVFFQEPFFDDTTIAHGVTAGTISTTEIVLVCSRTITGVAFDADFVVTINGTLATISSVVPVGKDITVTIAETILGTDTLKLSVAANDANNIGIVTDGTVVNSVPV